VILRGRSERDSLIPMADAPSDSLRDVELTARLELGRALLPVRDLLQLGPGAVVELDRRIGDPVDLFVNDRLVARGEIVVAGGSFSLRVIEVLSPDATGER
jgi:flagellar motor switch protein FliN/FliY